MPLLKNNEKILSTTATTSTIINCSDWLTTFTFDLEEQAEAVAENISQLLLQTYIFHLITIVTSIMVEVVAEIGVSKTNCLLKRRDSKVGSHNVSDEKK